MQNNKTYKVKEIYYTIQGEGFHAGRSAVFCRFAGCNLWSGLEKDRASAICKFCDTDFWGTDGTEGGKYSLAELVNKITDLFPTDDERMVVFTGGEPALQIDHDLVESLQKNGFYVAIETNGTLELPQNIDWVCLSPKADTDIKVTSGHELKLVYPQDENKPDDYLNLDFKHKYLQPKEDINWDENTKATLEYIMSHPIWKLSVQTHKYLNIR